MESRKILEEHVRPLVLVVLVLVVTMRLRMVMVMVVKKYPSLGSDYLVM